MRKVIAYSVAVSLFTLSAACGGDSAPSVPAPPPTTLPTRGSWSIAVTPNPILATPSGDPQFPWSAAWRVTITDTAGLSGDINRVVTTARNNFGFTFTVSDFNPDSFIRGVGTNHINARGSLTFTDDMTYRADGSGGSQIVMTIAAEIIDPFGNRVTTSTDVRITDVGEAVPLP